MSVRTATTHQPGAGGHALGGAGAWSGASCDSQFELMPPTVYRSTPLARAPRPEPRCQAL